MSVCVCVCVVCYCHTAFEAANSVSQRRDCEEAGRRGMQERRARGGLVGGRVTGGGLEETRGRLRMNGGLPRLLLTYRPFVLLVW